MDTPWRLARVKSNFEKTVATHLTARSVENYLPLVVQAVQWTDRVVMTSLPLFAGYVFVRYTPMQRQLVLSTPGMIANGLGEVIPDLELKRIGTALNQGYKLESYLGAGIGSRVRFRNGVFSGTDGIVVPSGDRIKVVVGLSGCVLLFSVESELEDIEVVD